MTKQETLSVFPEALEEYILPKLHEMREVVRYGMERYSSFDFGKHPDGYFYRELVKAFILEDVLDAEKEIRRLEKYLPAKKIQGGLSEDMLTRAREASILEVARDLEGLKRSGTKWFARCLFHKEKSASLCLYPGDNHFFCFGCEKSGDVIDLARSLYGYSFIDAVKYLAATYG